MFKFPYTNLHELNLDWILEKVKTLVANNDEFNDKADYAVETADEAKTIAEQAAQAQIADGAVTTPKLADDAVTTPKLADGTIIRPNLLDNWCFVGSKFPINQRGLTNFTTQGYTIDRWKQSGSSGTMSVTADGIQLNETGTALAGQIFDQLCEDDSLLIGKKVTLSVLIESMTSPYVFQCGGVTFTAHETGLQTFTVNSFVHQEYLVRIYNLTAGGSAVIKAIKVELGDTQTLAHLEGNDWVLNEIPDFRAELAKCQRYQIALIPEGGIYQWVGSGITWNTTEADAFIPTPVTMRSNPTPEDPQNWEVRNPDGFVPSSITLQRNAGGLKAVLAITDGVRGTPLMIGNGSSSSRLIVSCNL